MNAGIDYSMGLGPNKDPKTGIRYGVISQHSVLQAWADSAEAYYGEPACPKCENECYEFDTDGQGPTGTHLNDTEHWDHASHEDDTYYCPSCRYVFGSESAFAEDPIGWYYDAEGYNLSDCLDSDIMVCLSPYYTFAQFCSPCCPGAGNLDTPMPEGIKCYALGHDWFDDRIAPYPVYRVSDDIQMIATRDLVDCRYCAGTGKRTTQSLADARGQSRAETETAIADGSIAGIKGYDPVAHTFECGVCDGTGKRSEVVVREAD
jgi:hypothetical protein